MKLDLHRESSIFHLTHFLDRRTYLRHKSLLECIALSAIAARQKFYFFAAVGLKKIRGGQTLRCKNTVKWSYILITHIARPPTAS